jgi:hypothetical protein
MVHFLLRKLFNWTMNFFDTAIRPTFAAARHAGNMTAGRGLVQRRASITVLGSAAACGWVVVTLGKNVNLTY